MVSDEEVLLGIASSEDIESRSRPGIFATDSSRGRGPASLETSGRDAPVLILGPERGKAMNTKALRFGCAVILLCSRLPFFAAVLAELGGVSDNNLTLLTDPGLSAFRGALQRMRQMVSAADSRGKDCRLVLDYSGHSDECSP